MQTRSRHGGPIPQEQHRGPSDAAIPAATYADSAAPTRPLNSAGATHRATTSACAPAEGTRIGFTLNRNFYPARNVIDVLPQVFEVLTQKDPPFPERFAGLPKHGNKRRYLTSDANELYPGRPELCRDSAIQLTSGWWLVTNHSRQTSTSLPKNT
jgi:hypothetical protein